MIDWTLLTIVGIILLSLLLFVIVRNRRDKKDLVEKLNQDYRKPKEEEGDSDIEDTRKV